MKLGKCTRCGKENVAVVHIEDLGFGDYCHECLTQDFNEFGGTIANGQQQETLDEISASLQQTNRSIDTHRTISGVVGIIELVIIIGIISWIIMTFS